MARLIIYIFLLLFTGLLPYGCNKNQGRQLKVNQLLLGAAVRHSGSGFTFSPPAGWAKTEGAFLNAYLKNNETDERTRKRFRFMPVFLYHNSRLGAGLLVTIVEFDPVTSGGSILDTYSGYVSNSLRRFVLKQEVLTNNGITMTSFSIKKDNLFTNRILLTTASGSVVQFDFTFPSEQAAENAGSAIESCLGSIQVP